MSDSDQNSGIFDGTDVAIASFFKLRDNQHLKQRSVSRGLNAPGAGDEDFLALVSDLYDCIESKHSGRPPSQEKWRSKRVTTLSDHNKSPEVLLERAVAMLGEAGILPGWLNQVPVASGFINDRFDKRAALDLVKLEDDVVRFVELKWESDTPAYAAFEVLRYGLVYLFSRVNVAEFGYGDRRMMRVGRVALQVLAPSVFFDKHDLGWLERGLDHALDNTSRQKTSDQLSMGSNSSPSRPILNCRFAMARKLGPHVRPNHPPKARAGCAKLSTTSPPYGLP